MCGFKIDSHNSVVTLTILDYKESHYIVCSFPYVFVTMVQLVYNLFDLK